MMRTSFVALFGVLRKTHLFEGAESGGEFGQIVSGLLNSATSLWTCTTNLVGRLKLGLA